MVPEVGGIILGFPDARSDPVEARAPRGRNTNRVVAFGERQLYLRYLSGGGPSGTSFATGRPPSHKGARNCATVESAHRGEML